MKKSELVFIPWPMVGHLVSTVEIAKRLIDQDDRISVTILCIKLWLTPFADEFTKSLVGSETRIKLIDIPEPPSSELLIKTRKDYFYLYAESLVPQVRNTLKHIIMSSQSNSIQVSGLVLDFFCMPMLDVANELGLNSYIFFTCNLGFLSFFLHLPTCHDLIGSEFKDSDPDLILPGFANPVPVRLIPAHLFTKDGYSLMLKLAQRFRETKGILVNSFVELESHDIVESLISDGKTPPLYMIGPVVDLEGLPHPSADQAQQENIMEWLDEQPDSSVLFLCFGSVGCFFGASQLIEIALGLERSGYRFLWCATSQKPFRNVQEEITFPEGFLERTKGRGIVCEWAPQVEVLAHKAVGGFVSHCGWNSILESLWCGVPIATWPIYAEQQLNAFRMVREFGLAVELRLDYKYDRDVVMAEEIEMAVKRLMEGESEVRKKGKEMSKMARNAVAKGGSSFNALGQLIADVVRSM
ncbi:UDP-glycosyltransferase 71C3 [Morus notabilis]|uniref:Glycosyltransferase n=1 Tax=Morus notabilis TaxID=981085 RepID=W9S000_9ROSA|nr:UDP-glycosyltransferase 71K1 [Morus notabilis]EXC01453.1 UDP-glycosyltransferase 71C3 [Morus notabilis]